MQRRPRRLYLILAAVTLMVAGILAYWFIASAYTGPGAIKIEIATDKQSHLLGEEIQFRVHVYNPQLWRVTYPSRVNYRIGDEDLTKHITLASLPPSFPGQSRTLYDTYVGTKKQDQEATARKCYLENTCSPSPLTLQLSMAMKATAPSKSASLPTKQTH